MRKHTPGPWRLVNDAQGPCMVMHPKLEGVAIAALDDTFKPSNGFHDPVDNAPSDCEGAPGGTTYHSERVANARLIAAAPELLAALKALMRQDFKTGLSDRLERMAEKAIAKAEGH